MKKIIILLLTIMMVTVVFAQNQTTNPSAKLSGDLYNFPVKVWGEVVSPGIYDAPIGYDLLSILSLAGGPINTAKLTNVKVIRGHRLTKNEPLVIYVDLDKYIETGDDSLIPEIRIGDTIMVPPKFGKNFVSNFAAILAIAQSITIIAYYIDRVTE